MGKKRYIMETWKSNFGVWVSEVVKLEEIGKKELPSDNPQRIGMTKEQQFQAQRDGCKPKETLEEILNRFIANTSLIPEAAKEIKEHYQKNPEEICGGCPATMEIGKKIMLDKVLEVFDETWREWNKCHRYPTTLRNVMRKAISEVK